MFNPFLSLKIHIILNKNYELDIKKKDNFNNNQLKNKI
jgi:hypothetical protein